MEFARIIRIRARHAAVVDVVLHTDGVDPTRAVCVLSVK